MITLKIPTHTSDPATTRAKRRRIRASMGEKQDCPITITIVDKDGKETIFKVYGPGKCV